MPDFHQAYKKLKKHLLLWRGKKKYLCLVYRECQHICHPSNIVAYCIHITMLLSLYKQGGEIHYGHHRCWIAIVGWQFHKSYHTGLFNIKNIKWLGISDMKNWLWHNDYRDTIFSFKVHHSMLLYTVWPVDVYIDRWIELLRLWFTLWLLSAKPARPLRGNVQILFKIRTIYVKNVLKISFAKWWPCCFNTLGTVSK